MLATLGTRLRVAVLAAALGAGCDASGTSRQVDPQASARAERERYLRDHPEVAAREAAIAKRRAEAQAARDRLPTACTTAIRSVRSVLLPGTLPAGAKLVAAVLTPDTVEPGGPPEYEATIPEPIRGTPLDATHVMCLEEKRATVQTCTYGSGTHQINRTQATLEVTMVKLPNGQGAYVRLMGGTPGHCPASVQKSQPRTGTVDGPRVSLGAAIEAVLGRPRLAELRQAASRLAAIKARVGWVKGLSDRRVLEDLRARDAEPAVRQAAEERLGQLR